MHKTSEEVTTCHHPAQQQASFLVCRRPHKQIALILCPNTALCQQVIRLVNSLTSSADNKPLLHACQVSSSNPPPFDPPDIIVTTPGALVALFNDRGFNYGVQWTAEGVSNRALFVIVDEADLLSQGGYEQDLMRLLDVSSTAAAAMYLSFLMEAAIVAVKCPRHHNTYHRSHGHNHRWWCCC